jgi:hypothetical protein
MEVDDEEFVLGGDLHGFPSSGSEPEHLEKNLCALFPWATPAAQESLYFDLQ